jgi:hypothetical protein
MTRVYDLHYLYETLRGDEDVFLVEDGILTITDFEIKLNELATDGLVLIKTNTDDTLLYETKSGLVLSDFNEIRDQVKYDILSFMCENPKAFFMLGNTQNGKTRKIGGEMKQWSQEKSVKVVGFIVVDNDNALSDQFVASLRTQPVKLFRLSGIRGDTFDTIKDAIDAYAGDPTGERLMPLIVLLSNEIQNTKMVKLVAHIDRMARLYHSKLRYGIIWDECDVTYTRLREAPVLDMTIRTFIIEQTTALYKVGWVSATEGTLLDDQSFPECMNAQIYPFVPDPETQPFYRSFHLPEAMIHDVPFEGGLNRYASKVVSDNMAHFSTPIRKISEDGNSICNTYRKIIVNSTSTKIKMDELAKWFLGKDMNVIVFNNDQGTSLKLYMQGEAIDVFVIKGYTLNSLLFYIYKKRGLHTKPLAVIGNRKVNRGLSFSYCPRDAKPITIKGKLGDLVTQDREGLVFTDMILGRIDNVSSAVQKAGRLSGLIGDSPQYTGSIHFWTDGYTAEKILVHNRMVDAANQMDDMSIGDAIGKGTANSHENYKSDKFLVYTSEEKVRAVCGLLGYRFQLSQPDGPDGPPYQRPGFIRTSTGGRASLLTLARALIYVPSAAAGSVNGKPSDRSCFPCYKNEKDPSTLHYVVRIHHDTTLEMLEAAKVSFPPIVIPRFGKY